MDGVKNTNGMNPTLVVPQDYEVSEGASGVDLGGGSDAVTVVRDASLNVDGQDSVTPAVVPDLSERDVSHVRVEEIAQRVATELGTNAAVPEVDLSNDLQSDEVVVAVSDNEDSTLSRQEDVAVADTSATQTDVKVNNTDLPQGNGTSSGDPVNPTGTPAGWTALSGLQTATGVVVMLGSAYKTYQEVMKFVQTPKESDNGFAQKAYQFKNILLDRSRLASSENEPSALRTALYGGLTAVGVALILKA